MVHAANTFWESLDSFATSFGLEAPDLVFKGPKVHEEIPTLPTHASSCTNFHSTNLFEEVQPLITMLTMTCNPDVKWLKEAHEIRAQFLNHWKWVIVDGGSNAAHPHCH